MSLSTKGHRYLLIALGAAWTWVKHKMNFEAQVSHMVHGLMGLAMVLDSLPEIKTLFSKVPELPKPVTALLPILVLIGISGCSLSPQQVQSDTAIGVSLALDTAVRIEPKEQPNIDKDATLVATTLNDVIPQFFPGATAAHLSSVVVNHVTSILRTKLVASANGAKIMAVIDLLQGPLNSALGMTASPTALLTDSQRAYALSFFSGISQGVATHTKNPALNPPTPPPVTSPPPPTPAPAPGSTPPK